MARIIAMFEHDKLLRVDQVAEWLGVRESTIRFWMRLGMLPKVHVGLRAVRIPRTAVEALIRDGTTPARQKRKTGQAREALAGA